MKWLDKLNPFGGKIKQSNGSFLFQNQHSYKIEKWDSYAKEGYGLNPTVFSCIKLRAEAIARIPLYVKVNGEIVENHPLKKLLDQPNPDDGGVEYKIAASSWYDLTGNNFQQKIYGANGLPVQLYNWQPYEFSVKRQKGNPVPLYYIFGESTDYKKIWDVDQVTGRSEIMHWRSFNPDPQDSTMGQSPLKAAGSSADQSNSARKWNYNTLENSGSGSVVITTSEGASMSNEQRKQIQQDLNEKYKGAKNANKFWLLGQGMKIDKMSMSQRDMEWLAGLKMNAQEIASTYQTPTQLLGIEGSQTYANFAEARIAFYVMAVLPTLELLISEWNRWLAPDFGDNVEICYSKDDIEALEPLRMQKRQQLLDADILSINQKLELFGMKPRTEPEADMVYIDPQKIPLGFDLFDDEQRVIEENAKALVKMGYKEKEALQKAFDLYSDLRSPKD